jgi:hypothetical protein
VSSCIFTYDCLFFSCLLKKILFKIAEGSFSNYFTFIMMNLITFIACFMFRYFCQSWLICLENKEKIMVFRIFLYTISKLFWDELMYFLVIIVCFSYLLRKLLLKIAEGSFSVYFTFIMMNLITFIAFMFLVIFAKVDWFAWKRKKK